MAEASGAEHTLLGTHQFQATVDKLDGTVNKLDQAVDKMSGAATRISGSSGSSNGGSGLWNAGSNWLLGKSNGGGAVFGGIPGLGTSDPSSTAGKRRAEGPAQTPQWAQTAGNFAQVMSNGNGGRGIGGAYNMGAALGGTGVGVAAAGTVAISKGLAYGANGGVASSDMYNYNMLGGTATRMYTAGTGNVRSTTGVYGSADTGDYYASIYSLSKYGMYAPGSSGYVRQQSMIGGMGIMNPNTSAAQNTMALLAGSSNATVNSLKAYGINTFNNSPQNVASQLMSRLGIKADKKYTPAQIKMLMSQQAGLSTSLQGFVASGAMSQDYADSIQDSAYANLMGQSKGYSSAQMADLLQKASSGDKSASRTLKSIDPQFGSTTAQTVRNKNANTTKSSEAQLDSFAASLSDTTKMVNGLNTVLRNIPGVSRLTGMASGGGKLGKAHVAASVLGSAFLPPGVGHAIMGVEGKILEGLGGPGLSGGDSSINTAFSEAGTLMGGSTMPTASTSSTGLATYSAGGTSSAAGGGSTASGGGGNGKPSYGTADGIPMGRVSPSQALARIASMAAARVTLAKGYCQKYARQAYGIGSGAGSAVAAWNAAKYKHSMTDTPIAGCFVFWGGGDGHVAIYAGGGKVWSPGGPGDETHWVLCTIDAITRGWGKPLLGWTEDDNGTRVVRPAVTTNSSRLAGLGSTGGGSGIAGTVADPTATGGGSNQSIVKAVAKGYGWGSGGEWNALVNLVNSESGFNNNAQNPNSTAYGMFQFLDSTWSGYGVKKTSDPGVQAAAGLKYIKSRYGDPEKAWAFHKKNNWYDKGAWEIRDDEDARVHKGEMIIPKDPADQIRQVLLQNNTTNAGKGPASKHGASGLHFHDGAIRITIQGSHGDTAALGRGLGRRLAQELAQDARINALLTGK